MNMTMNAAENKDFAALVSLGKLAAENLSAACSEWKKLLEEPKGFTEAIQQIFGLSAEDWTLAGLYFYELTVNGTVPDETQYRTFCRDLDRLCTEKLPALLSWGVNGIQFSPVCRDYILRREPELPAGCELLLCTPKQIFHDESIVREAETFLKACAQQADEKTAAVLLCGEKGSGRRFVLQQTAAGMNGNLLRIDPRLFRARDAQEVVLACILYNAFPLIEEYTQENEWLFRLLADQLRILFLTSQQSVPVSGCLVLERRIEGLNQQRRTEAMQMLFPQIRAEEVQWQHLAQLHRLQTGALCAAADRFSAECMCFPEEKWMHRLETLLRELDTPSFAGRAQQLSTQKRMEDLILPEAQSRMLKNICAFARQKDRLYEEWGFNQKIPYGRGISALFYGASGTGKTMAASVVANEIGLPLYRVDLAQITSKYIGETQKNIRSIFEEAQKSECVLFFDEADALFARRSEGGDAQDKYSNGEIAYLLQETERYPGVTILATNLLQNFDEAFRRRINFMVRFPLPDAALRKKLWETIFPKETPLGDVDYEFLAHQFELSGAGIRNCAVYAAFLAMNENRPAGMFHILEAVRNEYEKMGKTVDPKLIQMYTEEGNPL